MDKFAYYSEDSRHSIVKYVPINGVNTTFMWDYEGSRNAKKDRKGEKMIDQEIARMREENYE